MTLSHKELRELYEAAERRIEREGDMKIRSALEGARDIFGQLLIRGAEKPTS